MRLGLQMISIKDVMAMDICASIEDVGRVGYEGVEFARGFFGKTVEELKHSLDKMNMCAIGNHVFLTELRKDFHRQITYARQLNMHHIVALGSVPNTAQESEVKSYIAELKDLAVQCREQKIALSIHGSTDFYQRDVNGILLLERLAEEIPCLELQIDTAWAVCAGENPVRLIQRYGDRMYSVHLKDFHPPIPSRGDIYKRKEEALTRDSAVGDNGVIDLESVLRAAQDAGILWLIVEHMERKTYEDSIRATRISFENVTMHLQNISKSLLN